MDRVRNPYSPGAGAPPPALVGRTKQIEDMDVALQRRLLGKPAKSLMLTGLRGVGKTVLLNEFSKTALSRGYEHEHIEADENVNFPAEVASIMRRILLRLSAKHRLGERVQRVLGILKAFSIKIPNGPEFTIDVDAVYGPADSGNLASDLAALLREVSEIAQAASTGVFLTIDEIQYLAPDSLSALILGLHRVSQLSLPLVIAGAGLPSAPGLLGEAKSYAERMFAHPEIGSLSRPDAREAIAAPALDEGVRWNEDALSSVVERTEGYPYFLQEFGKQTWDLAPGSEVITLEDVQSSIDVTLAELDAGFFRVRIDRTTPTERAYLRAMAALGPGPHQSADVAAELGKKTGQIGPTRDRLIKRGLCYMPHWGEIAFTVPMFDGFMRRWMP